MLLSAGHGLGVIGGDTVNLVGLGGCLPKGWFDTSSARPNSLHELFRFLDYASDDLPGYCTGGQLRSPTMWLGIFVGGFVPSASLTGGQELIRLDCSILTVLMLMYRVRGAILIGIFLVSIISWPRPTSVTYFPHTAAGDAMFNYFKKVVTFQPLDKIGNVIEVS